MNLAAKYNEMQTDGRLLSNKQSLEIVRTRIQQLLERIDLNEAPDRLAKLGKLWRKFRELDKAGSRPEALITAAEIDAEFEKAYHDYAAWEQMFNALDLDRKMVESEVKILKEIKAIITAEDAINFAAKIMSIIIRIEDNPKKLKRYQYEIGRLIGEFNAGDGHGWPEGGGEETGDPGSGSLDGEEFLHPGDEDESETEWSDSIDAVPEGRSP